MEVADEVQRRSLKTHLVWGIAQHLKAECLSLLADF